MVRSTDAKAMNPQTARTLPECLARGLGDPHEVWASLSYHCQEIGPSYPMGVNPGQGIWFLSVIQITRPQEAMGRRRRTGRTDIPRRAAVGALRALQPWSMAVSCWLNISTKRSVPKRKAPQLGGALDGEDGAGGLGIVPRLPRQSTRVS